MPRSRTAATRTQAAPVYTWAFKSSIPRAGGKLIDYITQLEEDGSLRCNCPGWVFKKKGQERRCKHTDQVQGEVKEIMRKYKAGETLELVDLGTGTAATAEQLQLRNAAESKITYGRVIEI